MPSCADRIRFRGQQKTKAPPPEQALGQAKAPVRLIGRNAAHPSFRIGQYIRGRIRDRWWPPIDSWNAMAGGVTIRPEW
jgi:hypothetical protein